jgi:hypothetical protein
MAARSMVLPTGTFWRLLHVRPESPGMKFAWWVRGAVSVQFSKTSDTFYWLSDCLTTLFNCVVYTLLMVWWLWMMKWIRYGRRGSWEIFKPYTCVSLREGVPIYCQRLKPGTSIIRSKAAYNSSLTFGLGYLKIYEVIAYRITTILNKL